MRILLVLPCCIGDVVMATAALTALRRGYPQAEITWAVGGWSRRAVEYHPALNRVLDTGGAALPVKSPPGFLRFVSQIRGFDVAVSLVRSPLMSAAVRLAGIPTRAGIDSGGRGFGYNLRVPLDPEERRHEAEIYLDVVAALGIDTDGCRANLPVVAAARSAVQMMLASRGVQTPYIVLNPAGGDNPGMQMPSKRWPAENFAKLGDALSNEMGVGVVLLAGPDDVRLVEAVSSQMKTPAAATFTGDLSFPQIGALAADARLYVGNDTGLTHLAAASGAKTIMILGPSDPARYAPYTDNSLALWKPTALKPGGVAASQGVVWDWARDGIRVEEALPQIRDFYQAD